MYLQILHIVVRGRQQVVAYKYHLIVSAYQTFFASELLYKNIFVHIFAYICMQCDQNSKWYTSSK